MAFDFQIRPFQPGDGPSLAALHRRTILAVSPRFYSRAERDSWAHGIRADAYEEIAEAGETFLVATTAGEVVLAFASHSVKDRKGRVGGLYTAPEAQGRGIGRALLAASESAFISAGAVCSKVTASFAALAFYERHGYEAVERARHRTRGGLEIGIWHMEKTL